MIKKAQDKIARSRAAARNAGAKADDAADTVGKKQPDACKIGNSFTPETRVVMADGSTKAIEDIQVGDEVLATDPESGLTVARPVIALIAGTGHKDLVEVTVDTDGDTGDDTGTVIATDGHPFWVESLGAWVDAEDLRPGDMLRTSAGTWTQVDAVREFARDHQRVHNLTIAGIHTYHVTTGNIDALVHNCGIDGIAGKLRNKANNTYLGRRLMGRPMEPWRSNRDLARQLGGRSPQPNATVRDLVDLVPGNEAIPYKVASAGGRSDADLLASVFRPGDGQYIATFGGVIGQGNHRVMELLARAADPSNSRINWDTPIFINRVGR